METPRPSIPENADFDRRTLLLMGIAGLINISRTASAQKVEQVVRPQEKQETDTQRWERFQCISEQLKQHGSLVVWNHPPSGPTKPKFVISNSHIPWGATNNDQRRAHAMLSEYRELQFLVGAGLKTFAFEGNPTGKPRDFPQFVFIPKTDKRVGILILGSALSWKEETHNELGAYLATPDQVRQKFDKDAFLRSTLESVTLDNPSETVSQIFIVSYSNNPSISCIGAESPALQRNLEQSLKNEKRYPAIFEEYNQAVDQAIDQDGRYKFDCKHDHDTGEFTHIRIGNKTFDAHELEQTLLWSLGQLPSQRERDVAREAYVANTLDADVVHFGNGHLRAFQKMKAARSVGTVLPLGTREAFPGLLDNVETRSQSFFLQSLNELKKTVKAKVQAAKEGGGTNPKK